MRYTGPARTVFTGDVAAAARLESVARTVAGDLFGRVDAIGQEYAYINTMPFPGVVVTVSRPTKLSVPIISVFVPLPEEDEEPEVEPIYLLHFDSDTRECSIERYDNLVVAREAVLEEFTTHSGAIQHFPGFAIHDDKVYRIDEERDGSIYITRLIVDGVVWAEYYFDGSEPVGWYAKDITTSPTAVYVYGVTPVPDSPEHFSWIEKFTLSGESLGLLQSWVGTLPSPNRQEWFSYGGGKLWVGQEANIDANSWEWVPPAGPHTPGYWVWLGVDGSTTGGGWSQPGYNILVSMDEDGGNLVATQPPDENYRTWPVAYKGPIVGATFWGDLVLRSDDGSVIGSVDTSTEGRISPALCLSSTNMYFRVEESAESDTVQFGVYSLSGTDISAISIREKDRSFGFRIETDGMYKL